MLLRASSPRSVPGTAQSDEAPIRAEPGRRGEIERAVAWNQSPAAVILRQPGNRSLKSDSVVVVAAYRARASRQIPAATS